MAMSDDFFSKINQRLASLPYAERNHQLPLQSEWPKQLKLRLSSPKHLSSHVWSLWQGLKEGTLAGALGWRAQMKGLKDFFFPDIDMQTYLGQLTGYCTTVFGLQKDVEETYRQFLFRVHQTVQPGLGCGLKMGWKALVKLGNGLQSLGLDSPTSKDMGWIALFCMVCVR
jgi:hypothetical protein